MSFFDEAEEETRVRPPAAGRRRRSGGGSRPPARPPRRGGRPPDERTIRIRQGVAAAVLLVALILIVIGVHSCSVSAGNSALRSYNDSVRSLIEASDQNGHRFLTLLSSGAGATNATNLQSQIESTRIAAANQLQRAESLSAPGQVTQAQQYLVTAMRMRRDGIANIGQQLQPALQGSNTAAAVNAIAAEMARLYGSDVIYKDYALPMVKQALQQAGIAVGGANGEPVATGQFVNNLQWLQPSYVAQELHTTGPSTSTAKPAPGVHGHELDSCSIGSTSLDPTAATSVPPGTTPTLTCTVTNDGQNTETNVAVKASVGGTSITGQGTIPQTQPGQQYTVTVPLSATPPAGTYSLTVTVERVPGEILVTHNTKVFPVTFG